MVGVGRSSQPQPSPKRGLTHQATQGQVVVGGWGSGQLVLPLVLVLLILDVTLSSPTSGSHLGDCCCPHLMLLLMGLVVVVVPVTVASLMLGVSTHLGMDGVGVLQLGVGVVHHGSCQLSSSCQLWRGRHRR